MQPTILISSGTYFDYLNPHTSSFEITDIAKGLSKTCRFSGQCDEFYSVAQHCVIAAEHAFYYHKLEVLMHDASEFVMCDIPSPLKQLIPDYCKIERSVQSVIHDRFGIHNPNHAYIKAIDNRMLATEQRDIMKNTDHWNRFKAYPEVITPWSHDKAYYEFMLAFSEYSK